MHLCEAQEGEEEEEEEEEEQEQEEQQQHKYMGIRKDHGQKSTSASLWERHCERCKLKHRVTESPETTTNLKRVYKQIWPNRCGRPNRACSGGSKRGTTWRAVKVSR